MSHERRVFLQNSAPLVEGQEVCLSAADSHHLSTVLRLKQSDCIVVVCAASRRDFRAVLSTFSNPLTVRLLEVIPRTSFTSKVNFLCLALLKAKKNELVLEKAVELGARHVLFWPSEHSVKKVLAEKETTRLERWQKIAESAARQSGKSKVPAVYFAKGQNELLEVIRSFSTAKDRNFCCSLSPAAQTMECIRPPEAAVNFLLGPEGGLSENEEKFFVDSGFELLSLMPYRLRSETAAVSAVAIAQAFWGYK